MSFEQAFPADTMIRFKQRLLHRLKELAEESGQTDFILPVGLVLVLDKENGGDATAQELTSRFNLLDFESRNVKGVATYVQMAHIAVQDPEGLDGAISFLPTEELGQPPYRQWFDQLNGLLSLEPDMPLGEHRLKISAQADFVIALGHYALNSDVLTTFPRPSDLDLRSFQSFLEHGGPDIRLVRMIGRLKHDGILERLISEFRFQCDLKRAGRRGDEEAIEWLRDSKIIMHPSRWVLGRYRRTIFPAQVDDAAVFRSCPWPVAST
jgi:hypothetical protein